MPKFSWIFLPVLLVFTFLTGCEDDEANKLLKAQDCLNHATVATANSCESHVSGLTSSQSWIIRCSARMLAGGLDEDKIVTAYDAADNAGSGELEATLMTNLTFDSGATPADNTANAADAFDACQKTKVDGLIYLGGIVNVGTQLVNAIGAGGFTTPDEFVDHCEANPGDCNTTEIGEVAIAISASYCTGGNADSEVCTAINSAIQAGGNAATIGQNLLNLIDPNSGT